MSYSVDWIGKIISIPTSDLTLVSGTRYELQMSDFLGEIRRLESAFDQGLWAPQILDHTNPKTNFAGADYAGFDEIINGYTVQVTGAATRVDLKGSNNNLIDVLIPTGVSIVPSNSLGLQLVSVGSGLSAEEQNQLATTYNTVQEHIPNIEGSMGLKQMLRMLSAQGCNNMTYNEGLGQWEFWDRTGTQVRMRASIDPGTNRIITMWNPS